MKKVLFGDKLKKLGKKLLKIYKHEVPRGCFPVDLVCEAEPIRYIISVDFLNSACFKSLLDEYEEEIRVHTRGPLTLPCPAYKFEIALYRDRIDSRMIKV